MSSVYSPGRNLGQLVLSLGNVPGAIARVSTELLNNGVEILTGFHTALPGQKEAVWSFFVDLTRTDVTLEELTEKIRGIGVVASAGFARQESDGLIINEQNFPLLSGSERSIVLQSSAVEYMFRRICEVYGSGAAVIQHEMGASLGASSIRRTCESFGVTGMKALKVNLAERLAEGWGISDIQEYDEKQGRVTVRVVDLFECLPLRGRCDRCNSHFFRGYLKGVLDFLFERKVTVAEFECIARGDPQCVFMTR